MKIRPGFEQKVIDMLRAHARKRNNVEILNASDDELIEAVNDVFSDPNSFAMSQMKRKLQ